MAAGDAASGAARRVIVVAGMHRAGTSVVARGLQALGIDLGDALMSADVRMNARGFFEDMDIVKLDDALLDAQGADWKNLALLDGVDWEDAAHASASSDARRMLEGKLARTGLFGFKDPRVPRLLPFWQRVFAELRVADAYVIAVRHPQAVIDSLSARDGLDVRRSGWLWLEHLLCALRYTQGRPRIVVDYDRLLAAPDRELARMASALALPAAAPVGDDATVYANTFLSPELRHAEYAPDCIDAAALPPFVAAAHVLAQRLARDEADVRSSDTIAEIDALYERVATLSPLLAYVGSVERAADEMPRITGELAWASASLAEATAYNERLQNARREDVTYNESLRTTLERKEAELVTAHSILDRLRERAVGRMLLRSIDRES